ncbi:glycosyltransferase family 4 protein [Paenibacillus agilis]|uniref:Glycosyltransferase family 4 protein n=1 Tax=Paenibacillus agilis TaxID=3020863 RepID=A0A559J1F7_9BACL|nr:glycosyltransferase family 4 protein [Paenibacillus agilis]TVX93719.1 glycosyltransferase family 4 protein [Paenibacillus agilis]
MKVAILTMFTGLSSTYSVVNVVAEQLRMLLDAHVATKLLVSERFSDEEKVGVFLDERIEWVKITNKRNLNIMENGKVRDGFYEEADVMAHDFVRNLSDVDVCFMHDILYLGEFLLQNVAVRTAQQQLPGVRFLAFTHSSPEPRHKTDWPFSARFMPMPNTIYVYPIASGIPALAKQYDVPEEMCQVVNNSLDFLAFCSDEVRTVAQKVDLLSPDYLVVYPARLSPGKQPEKVASFCGAIKELTRKSVTVLFCDFPSNEIDPKNYKTLIQLTGYENGLNVDDIVFTSDIGFEKGFPRKGVLELFTLSNLFVFPSASEALPLILLEAASRGNFLVVNEGVPALEDLGKKLGAYFMRWDAHNFRLRTTETYPQTEKVYLQEHAAKIVDRMQNDSVIHAKTLARQQFSPQWVWKNQLEPLLRK